MKYPKIQPGMKIRNLLILKTVEPHIDPSGHTRHRVLVRCDCGAEFSIQSMYIIRGDTKACRKCRITQRRELQDGDQIGDFTIIGYRDNAYICKCICGTEKLMKIYVLKINKTNNCGCKPRGSWKGVGQISSTYYYRMKRGAKIRNIPVNVSLKEISDLYDRQNNKCAITGLPIKISRKVREKSTASLDRIDSEKGYSIDNIQWVHVDINLMKMDFSMERLYELCELVIKNKNKGQNEVIETFQ